MKYQKELELLQNNVPKIFFETEKQNRKVSYKQRDEIVTSSDLYIENEIIKLIKEQFPGDHFHSEEFNRTTQLKDRTWLIDPIDGTSNYAYQLPLFVIQIALYDKGEVVLSYIHAPKINKTYHAVVSQGAFLNNQPMHTYSGEKRPGRLMSMVGLSHQTDKDKSMFMKMIDFSYENHIKIRILGTLGLEMAAMAEGSFVMLYTDVTNLWDIAPGLLLVKEAGGMIVNEKGLPYMFGDEHLIACCNEEIMRENHDYITKNH